LPQIGRVFFPGTPFDPFRAPICPTIIRASRLRCPLRTAALDNPVGRAASEIAKHIDFGKAARHAAADPKAAGPMTTLPGAEF